MIESEAKLIDEVKENFGSELKRHYKHIEFTFEPRPGEVVPCLMSLPAEKGGPYPVLIFLHGSHQNKEFIEEICTPFNEAGFAMIGFDQHMRGTRKVEGGVLTQAAAWRERFWKTPNDTRRLIDYLETDDRFDPERIYLVGASYGTITGVPTMALDKRIKAGMFVVGGGNIHNLVNSPAVKENLPQGVAEVISPLMKFFIGVADPIHLAPEISPRPVYMQNGEIDTVVTPESGQALFDALRDPKKIDWYPCDHPDLRPEDGPVVIQMLGDGLKWLIEQDEKVAAAMNKDAS
jgi:dienelactone hydrolase